MKVRLRPACVSNISDGGVFVSIPNMSPRLISRCQAITNIIESIAQEQAALGRILSAEADKLDKIVCLSDNPRELIQANQSVDRLIQSVHHLEMILQSKLGLFEECLCPSNCPPHEEAD